jgi:hypothetical protein
MHYDELWHTMQVGDVASARSRVDYTVQMIMRREEMVKKYSWALPTEEALETLRTLQPIVEIGAGTGYWAYELRKRNVEIHAYDKHPPTGEDFTEEEQAELAKGSDEKKNWYHRGYPAWTEVLQGTPDVLKTYDKTWNLFLCWPPMDDMAAYALGYHRGNYIAYVGESDGGCNANRLFFKLLHRFYLVETEIDIPQWPGLHDYMTIYRRKVVR